LSVGVKVTVDKVAEVVDPKHYYSKLPQDNSLLQATEREIGEFRERVQDYCQGINGELRKTRSKLKFPKDSEGHQQTNQITRTI
jgi:hypothetical protein